MTTDIALLVNMLLAEIAKLHAQAQASRVELEAANRAHRQRAEVWDKEREMRRGVIKNVATALCPNYSLECAQAEFELDGMGACQIIRRLHKTSPDWLCAEIARLREENQRLQLKAEIICNSFNRERDRAEKVEACLAETQRDIAAATIKLPWRAGYGPEYVPVAGSASESVKALLEVIDSRLAEARDRAEKAEAALQEARGTIVFLAKVSPAHQCAWMLDPKHRAVIDAACATSKKKEEI